MTVITYSRKSTFDEVVAEMDRRGAIIEKLEAEVLKAHPFSTYPEDREKMLSLSGAIVAGGVDVETFEQKSVELAEMVKSILEDEAFIFTAMEKDDGPTAA
jgi:hypothetical protein